MSSQNIKDIYKETKSKGVDYIGTILLIFVVFSLFGYLYTNAQNKLLQLNWNDQKCNPRYLFFSGFLNPVDKNPWISTEKNFNRCVSKSIYKDPNLSKEIKRNDYYIKKHDNEIKTNLNTGRKAVEDIRQQWEDIKDKKDMEVEMSKSDSGSIFEKQGSMHNTVTSTTTQMFNVLQSVLIYIQGILLYKVSTHKETLDIDKKHEYFMAKYETVYTKYKRAFEYLEETNWALSMNSAREAIDDFEKLSIELDEFIGEHMYQIDEISKSCYDLKYNLKDNSCEKLFPNLTKEWIDYYPIVKQIFSQ
jgi:hypothetical protein